MASLEARTQIANTLITDSVDKFNAVIDDFTKNLLPEHHLIFTKKIVLTLLGVIVRFTPVDTGRAKGSWQVELDQPSDRDIKRKTKSGNSTIAAGTGVLRKSKPFQDIWIFSNLEYIIHLEAGTPKMAPHAMVLRGIQKVQSETFGEA